MQPFEIDITKGNQNTNNNAFHNNFINNIFEIPIKTLGIF
jgi:hypothetical protein